MRDPAARLRFEPYAVVRELQAPLEDGHFLRSSLAREWVARGDLVSFEILDNDLLSARRLPFVSLPTEWCDLQFYRAAQLTLKLQREAVHAGYELKDASAWNVIFDGSRPIFCDLLSLERLRQKRWWAAGQFARHFILPLLVSKSRGFQAYKVFQSWRDGIPHEVAREMMGPSRFLTRYWPLMAGGGGGGSDGGGNEVNADLLAIQSFRRGLDQSLDWMLSGVDPQHSSVRASMWQNYVTERGHYSKADLDGKLKQVTAWMSRLQPAWVLDLGCNSGEFSLLAANVGAQVIAADADHGAIQRAALQSIERVHLLVAPIDDLRGGYGWNGVEHAGLPARLKRCADLTLVLALIHHLLISASVPLPAIAEFVAASSRRWLLVELIEPKDLQVAKMCSSRNRENDFPSVAAQLKAFEDAGFSARELVALPSGTRTLALLERTA